MKRPLLLNFFVQGGWISASLFLFCIHRVLNFVFAYRNAKMTKKKLFLIIFTTRLLCLSLITMVYLGIEVINTFLVICLYR